MTEYKETDVPAWRENREAILFGILASLIALVIGAIANIAYLIVVSTAAFLIFAFLMSRSIYIYMGYAERELAGKNTARQLEQVFTAPESRLKEKIDELNAVLKSIDSSDKEAAE